jgi:hypothetical protein
MLLLNEGSALTFAKEFTITALEHGMIKASDDPEQTAKDIATFYKTLAQSLNKED